MRQIRLNIGQQDSYAKLIWTPASEGPFLPYTIRPASLDRAIEQLRSRLEAVGAAGPDERDEAVRALAGAGKALRDLVFTPAEPGDSRTTDEVLDWFTNDVMAGADGVDLTVFSHPILALPWGLLHDSGHAADDPYADFWALRYRLVAPHHGMRPRGIVRPRLLGRLRLLTGIDEAVFSGVERNLTTDEAELVSALMEREVGTARNLAGCGKLWERVGANDCVLQIFGHGSGNGIGLSNGEVLTPEEFKHRFRRERGGADDDPSFVLSFFNGCRTAGAADGESFISQTAFPGFCGYIGLEADVPAWFAFRFGCALLVSLLQDGQSLRETMHRLWIRHRPLSLFYGCYASPEFRIAPDAGPAIPGGFDQVNLSEQWYQRGAA